MPWVAVQRNATVSVPSLESCPTTTFPSPETPHAWLCNQPGSFPSPWKLAVPAGGGEGGGGGGGVPPAGVQPESVACADDTPSLTVILHVGDVKPVRLIENRPSEAAVPSRRRRP